MLAIDPERTKNVTDQELDVTNLADLKPVGMLFQTGYLTIKGYEAGLYTLGVPDEEVLPTLRSRNGVRMFVFNMFLPISSFGNNLNNFSHAT